MGGYFVYVPRTKPGLVSLPPSHTISPFIAQAALVVRRCVDLGSGRLWRAGGRASTATFWERRRQTTRFQQFIAICNGMLFGAFMVSPMWVSVHLRASIWNLRWTCSGNHI